MFIQQTIKSLNEEWDDFVTFVQKLKQYIQIIYALKEQYLAALDLKKILDNYTDRFRQLYQNSILENISDNEMNSIRNEIDRCLEETLQMHQNERKFNETIFYNFFLKSPYLFICWPEPLTAFNVNDTRPVSKINWFTWKHINEDSPALANLNRENIILYPIQKYCIGYTGLLLNFNRNIIFMLQIVDLFKNYLNSLKKLNIELLPQNKNLKDSDKLIENSKIKKLQVLANWELNKHCISYNKIQDAMEKFSKWLANANIIIDEYDDEILLEKTSPEELVKLDESDLLPINTLSDISKFFDKKKSDINCLRDMIYSEETNYRFFCQRIVYIIFDQEESPLNQNNAEYYHQLEEMILNYFKEGQFTDIHYLYLISITNLINNWRLVIKKLEKIFKQFEYKSELVLTLEADYGLLMKLKETANNYLKSSIALGDLDSLNVQIENCKPFKEYVQSSAKNYVKNIIDNIQKIMTPNYFKENMFIVQQIKNIENEITEPINEFYQNLLNGLDLSSKLMQYLTDFDEQLDSIESRILSKQDIEDHILNYRNSTRPSDYKLTNIYDEIFTDLNSIHTEYEEKITNRLLPQILIFQSKSSETFALEQLKNMAEKILPERFEKLEKTLNKMKNNFQLFIKKMEEIFLLIDLEKEFLEKITEYHKNLESKQANIQDLENAVQAMDEAEYYTLEYNDHEQNVF